MILKIKRLSGSEDLELPCYQTSGSAGVDLRAAKRVSLRPGEICKIPTGVAVEIPLGFEGTIRGRSSLAAQGLIIHLGTIDSDYRGELVVLLINISDKPCAIGRGERIAQLIISPVLRVSIIEINDLTPSGRGEGGFGSTGRH